MASITTRAGKGSPLTNAEVDANFTNLNAELGEKLVASNLTPYLTSATAASTYQPLNADLTSIAGLAGASGFLKKTAANTWALDTNTYLTGNQSITFTGDATGSGSTAVTLTLANSGVAAGTYTKVTVDAKGRVTTGASLASGDVTSALGYTPYNSTNPNGYTSNTGTVTSVSGTGTVSGLTLTGTVTGSGSLTLGGTLSLTSGQVTTALGYTPYNSTNPNGYITGSGSISGNAATATNISNTGTVTLASATESNSIYVTAPSYTTDAPVKLLNFDWYGNLFSMGNIRSGSTPSNGFGVYYTASGGSRTEIARFGTDSSLNVAGALKQAGNQVLHAGNYSSYSPSLTGSGASGTWSISISGNAASASSVAWTNVSGRPTAVSSFTNDSGYITSSTLNDYTNGAYRVIADYSGSNTWYIRSNGRFTWARGHDWTQAFELNLESGTSASNNGWAEFGQRQSNNAAGTWYGTRFVQYTGSTKTDGHIRAGNHYLGADNSYITNAGDSSARVQTAYGYIDIGPKNGSWCHIYSDKTFYFNQELYVNNVQVVKNSGTWGISITGSAASASTSSQVTINYNNDSNSTYQMLWGAGNSVYGTGGIYCNPSSDYLYAGSFYCGNWFRSSGSTGWYNESYAVGIYATEATNVRTYNSANFIAGGNVTAYSDERVKTNWRALPSDFLEQLAGLKSGIYDRTDTSTAVTQVGVGAQSLEKFLPEAIVRTGNDELSVAYGNAALVSAVELAKRVLRLEAQLAKLIGD